MLQEEEDMRAAQRQLEGSDIDHDLQLAMQLQKGELTGQSVI